MAINPTQMGISMLTFFQLIVLIFSAIIHEYMHGWAADRQGDPTARLSGRLTLNPIPHLDLFGSFLLPLLLYLSSFPFLFGYAKPVPVNPNNLSDRKYGFAKVALAGPMANIVTAVFFGLTLRFLIYSGILVNTLPVVSSLLQIVVYINLLLAAFNLMPIPPLDGSKILMPFLPYGLQVRLAELERFGMIFVLLFVWFGFFLISPIILFFFSLITGIR